MFARPNNSKSLPGEDFDTALLQETGSRLSEAVPMHEVLNEVVRFVTLVVKCDSYLVYVFENDELVLRASENPYKEAVDQLKPRVGQGIAGWVVQNREPVVIVERAYEDFRFKLFNELPEDRFEAFLSVPVIGGGKSVGVINVQSLAPQKFGEREVSMIGTIGSLLGSKIEIARLTGDNALLSERMGTRTLVDRAKKILQSDLEISEENAYRTMQLESQHRNKRMSEIAEAIILRDELKHTSRQRSSVGLRNRGIAISRDCQEFKSPQSKT